MAAQESPEKQMIKEKQHDDGRHAAVVAVVKMNALWFARGFWLRFTGGPYQAQDFPPNSVRAAAKSSDQIFVITDRVQIVMMIIIMIFIMMNMMMMSILVIIIIITCV